jgi:hypothetical protein
MSIFKETFKKHVRDQLSIREEVIDIGNIPLGDVQERHDRLKTRTNVKLQTGKVVDITAGAFYNYTLNRQCVIRATSMVDYVEDVGLKIGDLKGRTSFERLKGATLSQNFILEGGVLSDYARNLDQDGDGTNERVVRRVDRPRGSFIKPGQKTNLAYGDLALGADATSDGYGIVPMPGITNATIRTKSAYGSLREARVEFVVHNQRQLEVMEMLYMRPGYTVLLEWGWAPFIDNNGKLVTNFKYLEDITNGKIYTNAITQNDIYNGINKLKEQSSSNYDGLMGFVKNFGYQAREDGGYDCFTELISMGEVIESLKIPNLPTFRTTFDPYSNPYKDEVLSIISSKSNALHGLMKNLYNFVTYKPANFFEGSTNLGGNTQEEDIERLYNDSFSEDPQTGPEEVKNSQILSALEAEGYDVDRDNLANNKTNVKRYFEKLLAEEAASVQSYLFNALKLGIAGILSGGLRNYIISRNTLLDGPEIRSSVLGSGEANLPVKPYIRWDALCILLNHALINKDEKGIPPCYILSDRIYDDKTESAKIDPLLYAPVLDEFGNLDIDFSCDSNICILPHQFDTNQSLESVFGHVPDLSAFPTDYLILAYRKNKPIVYNNSTIRVSGPEEPGTLVPLTPQDKNRRIGSIFLNIDMLVGIAEKNKDNDDYTVGKFINDVWKQVNSACPNHNFVLVDDKESSSVYIIDLPVDSTNLPKDLHTFIPFSNKNTFRNFDYQTSVPSALSATIAIQAQDPRNIENIDGVTFAAFNKSIKNRLFSRDNESIFSKVKNNINDRRTQLFKEQSTLRSLLIEYTTNFFKNITLDAMDIEGDRTTEGNIKGVLKTYQNNSQYLRKSLEQKQSIASVIPLNFNAELDGISGVVIGNVFKIQKDRLPAAYQKSNVGFIVFNEEQTITAGQDWTTKIGGKLILLDNNKSFESIKYVPDDEDNSEENKVDIIQSEIEYGQGFAAADATRVETPYIDPNITTDVNESNLTESEQELANSLEEYGNQELEPEYTGPRLIETYRGFEIYQYGNSYETKVDIIIDGEVEVEGGEDSFTNIWYLKEIIDESLE